MILQDVLQWNHTEMGWFFRCKTTMTSTHFATQEPAMVGWSFKNTRCFDQGRYMYRFAPEVSDCFMSWSNFRAHLLNSKWGRSIVFDIGRLLKKQYSNTAYRYIQEIVPPRFAIVPAPMCVMHIISTVDFSIRVLRSCCVSCHASQFDSGGGSYDQQIGDTFLRPPVLVGTFTRIEQFKLPSGKLT